MGLSSALGEGDDLVQFLREELHRQDVKFKELTHRVTNGYHAVSIRLRVQARNIKDPEARALCVKMAEHVEAMALVHRHLYGTQDSSLQNLNEYLELLCHDLNAAMVRKTIAITTDMETDIIVGTEAATTIGMVVAEAIMNASKHAFKGRKGVIHVRLYRTASGLEIAVSDTGRGLPEDFDDTSGLGVRLMRHQARSLGGQLAFTSTERGTTLVFSLPIKTHVPEKEARA